MASPAVPSSVQSLPLVVVAIALLVGAATLVSFGEDDDPSPTATIAKQDFVRQAERICRAGTARLDRRTADVDPDDAVAVQQAIRDEVVPAVRDQVADLRALGRPEPGAERVDRLLDRTDRILDRVAADPTLLAQDPFAKVNRGLTAYGLLACGAD